MWLLYSKLIFFKGVYTHWKKKWTNKIFKFFKLYIKINEAFYFLYKRIWLVIGFVISFFAPLKRAPAEYENTSKTYGAFLNLFHPKVKRSTRKLERIKNRISRPEVSKLFNQTGLKRNIYIYKERERGGVMVLTSSLGELIEREILQYY